LFDSNCDGVIDFREFIVAISITSRGSMSDKIEWAFKLYDIDEDNRISMEDMKIVISAFYDMVILTSSPVLVGD
jgi:Ca2+-binding EF-hand superfamily protein